MPDNSNNPNSGTPNASSNGNGSAQPAAAGPAMPPRPTVEPTVAARRERFMVASRPLPGIQPMAADVLSNQVGNMPDVKVVKLIRPRGFGALSTGGGGGGTMPDIIVAEMDAVKGAQLRATAPPHVIVEPDAPLRHAEDFSAAFAAPPGLLPAVGFDVKLRVAGTSGRLLPKATVYVYGPGFPAQGVTDDKGEVTVTLFGGSIDTVQAIYVKPAADYWDRMIVQPGLSSGVNTIQLRALTDDYPGFPQTALPGWGQQMMKLDQIDPSLGGQHVRIGIIDSGCDNTHPQLRHVTNGMDFTNNRDAASWTNDTMSHGTHCAGIITAASSQVKGIRGFAPAAEVHSLKVFPGGRFSDLIDALDTCIERQIDIVNMSLGSGDSSELVANKLVDVRQHGVACIVAAGNASGPVQFPGTESSVFTVAAIGQLGQFPADSYHAQTVVQGLIAGSMFSPKFTCFGPQVAIAGPGVAIISTVPGGGYASWDGTSMATPHITGMGALLLAHHPVFQNNFRARNEQRVAQLFSMLAGAGVQQLGDATREGTGLPNLQKVIGLGSGTARPGEGVQVASAPPTAPVLGNAVGGGQIGGLMPPGVIWVDPRAFRGGPGQLAPIQIGPFAANAGINPAVLQELLRLRNAGLV
jgi:subtilisin family serine protease